MSRARVLLSLSALLLGGCAGNAGSQETGDPPIRNVLVLMSDDHAAYTTGVYGNPIIRTPKIDRLAAEGVLFSRAYANAPVCSPSRYSILTGRLPHAVGATLLDTLLSEDQLTIAEHLQSQGFKTGAVGKMAFYTAANHGFEYRIKSQDHDDYLQAHPPRQPPPGTPTRAVWKPFHDPAATWLNSEGLPGTGYPAPADFEHRGLYNDDFLGTFFASLAIDFMTRNRDERFCLWLSFYEPHSPFNFPIEFAGRYDTAEIPVPEAGPEDERWIPEIFRDLSEQEKRGITRSYYTSVEYLDKNIGMVLDALKDLDLDRNTLVIYVSDHGYLLGHHGRFEKHSMWEEAVRVPLIIRDPRFVSRTVDALVELIDLVPTILETLQVPPMPGQQGKSLTNLLRGGEDHHRDLVFSEYLDDHRAMVRSQRWKYVITSGKHDLALGYATGLGPSGRFESLHDLHEDPGESNNLAVESEFSEVLSDMRSRMLEIFQNTHPNAAAMPPGLSILEKLEWFLEPPER